MASAIVMVELKGFSNMASVLADRVEHVSITPDRVRSSGIAIVNAVIDSCAGAPILREQIGGDTWLLLFPEFEAAIVFGCEFLLRCQKQALEQGLFFVKPAVGVGYGDPKVQDGKFLDDASIRTYRVADKGKCFGLYLVDAAIPRGKGLDWLAFAAEATDALVDGIDTLEVDWQASQVPLPLVDIARIVLPTLLLDNDVIYSDSTAQALENIMRRQSAAKSVLAFGGPVPVDTEEYRDYLASALAIVRHDPSCKWTILSYLPVNEASSSYAWVELWRQLTIEYDHVAFAAFIIPDGQLRPFSYHIYDDAVIHIGLRSFSAHRGAPAMNSAIMLNNKRIASRFKEEFMENWRRVGSLDDEGATAIYRELGGLTKDVQRQAKHAIEALLRE